MEHVVKELHNDINEASKHSNLDSAKKRAVMQHMDYENFRQMVLGAHLFPLKSGSTASIINTQRQLTRDSFNATEAYNLIVAKGKGEVGYDEEIVKNTLQMTKTDQFEAPKTPAEVERFLSKKCKDSMQRYIYLRVIAFEHFCKIFTNQEVDTDLLLLLCRTFTEQVAENESFNNQEEQEFVCQFLTMISTVSTSFDFVLEFLGDPEKQLITNLISKLTQVDTSAL